MHPCQGVRLEPLCVRTPQSQRAAVDLLKIRHLRVVYVRKLWIGRFVIPFVVGCGHIPGVGVSHRVVHGVVHYQQFATRLHGHVAPSSWNHIHCRHGHVGIHDVRFVFLLHGGQEIAFCYHERVSVEHVVSIVVNYKILVSIIVAPLCVYCSCTENFCQYESLVSDVCRILVRLRYHLQREVHDGVFL